jgi:formylglycine-generating enzyme required for sulfatase activity
VYYTDAGFTKPILVVDNKAVNDSTKVAGEDDIFIKNTANGFRLPGTWEWECAARFQNGGWMKGNHASGDATGCCQSAPSNPCTVSDDIANYAWYLANSGGSTHEVAATTKTPNALGIYDMSGNVWEWCFDWHPSYIGSYRMIRGGCWYYYAYNLQVGYVYYLYCAAIRAQAMALSPWSQRFLPV